MPNGGPSRHPLALRSPPVYARAVLPEVAETVIVGAGPSGLAVAACLKRAGLEAVVLDKAAAVGSSWRAHYERLHLHTTRERSGLPGLPFPERFPRYPARAQVVEYLEAYAAHFDLAPHLGVCVTAARRAEGRWQLETDAGPVRARHLVVASGYNAIPNRPRLPGLEDFAGEVLHSADYRVGHPFAGRRVVVVGCGNSGAEIALDLFESGAAAVTMIIRSPRYVAPRELYGVPAQTTSLLLGRLPRRLGDALGRLASRLAMGDLTPFGFRQPDAGPLTEVDRHGRVALVDVGTIDLIRQGAIRTGPAIARVEADAVICVDGQRIPADVLVLATGYRAGIAGFLDAPEALDARGLPRWHGRAGALPGLFFCGFRNPSGGALRESAREADQIAAAIVEGR